MTSFSSPPPFGLSGLPSSLPCLWFPVYCNVVLCFAVLCSLCRATCMLPSPYHTQGRDLSPEDVAVITPYSGGCNAVGMYYVCQVTYSEEVCNNNNNNTVLNYA